VTSGVRQIFSKIFAFLYEQSNTPTDPRRFKPFQTKFKLIFKVKFPAFQSNSK